MSIQKKTVQFIDPKPIQEQVTIDNKSAAITSASATTPTTSAPAPPGVLNTGPCLSLFFNLTISQLFSSAIGTIIEFLRVLTTNFLIRYFLKESFVKKYGMYIQPIVQAVFLLIVAIIIFFIYDYMRHHEQLCSNEGIMKIFGVGILSLLFFIVFIMVLIGFYKLYKKYSMIHKIPKRESN